MTSTNSKFWPGFDAAFRSGGFLKPNPTIHGLSITSVMLEMHYKDQLLAKGTGWFWRLPDGVALVTAWHNFSGLHHMLRRPLSRSGGMPDRVRYRYMATAPQTFQDAEVPLYIDAERTQPRWFVHPVCGSYFDMAFLLLDIQGGQVACVNDTVPILTSPARPAYDVFAVGFPQGVRTINVLPVWKRGSIASDPDVSVEGHPKFYIDLAGRGGLSGAPVYRVQQGVVLEGDGANRAIGFGEKTEFLGLYSGRAADQLPADARTGESTDLVLCGAPKPCWKCSWVGRSTSSPRSARARSPSPIYGGAPIHRPRDSEPVRRAGWRSRAAARWEFTAAEPSEAAR